MNESKAKGYRYFCYYNIETNNEGIAKFNVKPEATLGTYSYYLDGAYGFMHHYDIDVLNFSVLGSSVSEQKTVFRLAYSDLIHT